MSHMTHMVVMEVEFTHLLTHSGIFQLHYPTTSFTERKEGTLDLSTVPLVWAQCLLLCVSWVSECKNKGPLTWKSTAHHVIFWTNVMNILKISCHAHLKQDILKYRFLTLYIWRFSFIYIAITTQFSSFLNIRSTYLARIPQIYTYNLCDNHHSFLFCKSFMNWTIKHV